LGEVEQIWTEIIGILVAQTVRYCLHGSAFFTGYVQRKKIVTKSGAGHLSDGSIMTALTENDWRLMTSIPQYFT